MKAKILWIEGKRAFGPYFIPDLRKKDFSVEIVATGKAAKRHLAEDKFDIVVLNAATFRTSGKRICSDIRSEWEKLPILMIANPDKPVSNDVGADVLLELPFTIRKLVNRINPMLPHSSSRVLRTGPIHLDLERRIVRCQEKEAQLTPRLTSLLQIFMEHPNEVLERENIFRKIWNTEYTGDTRTLDVHISWIRQAIEPNPRKPRLLITIRSVGYRLDI
jgi:DNA-binding response OmpR family regulator